MTTSGWEGEEAPPAATEPTDWEAEPARRSWGGPAAAVAARRRRVHPVALVAIYAAAGIGVIVLASTALLGGADNATPAPVKQVVVATPTVVATPVVDVAAEAAEARDAFVHERARAQAAERRELVAARKAAARREKAAAARRQREKAAATAARTPVTVAPQATATAPVQTYHPPVTTGGGGSGGGGCEFCIG